MSAGRLAYNISEAGDTANTGRTAIYKAIQSGELRAVKRGRRTLILADDLRRWLESLPAVTPTPATKTVIAHTNAADIIAAWNNAPANERRKALDGIGLEQLLATLPEHWILVDRRHGRPTVTAPADPASDDIPAPEAPNADAKVSGDPEADDETERVLKYADVVRANHLQGQ
jgi:excisionase family DNA binding protein